MCTGVVHAGAPCTLASPPRPPCMHVPTTLSTQGGASSRRNRPQPPLHRQWQLIHHLYLIPELYTTHQVVRCPEVCMLLLLNLLAGQLTRSSKVLFCSVIR